MGEFDTFMQSTTKYQPSV